MFLSEVEAWSRNQLFGSWGHTSLWFWCCGGGGHRPCVLDYTVASKYCHACVLKLSKWDEDSPQFQDWYRIHDCCKDFDGSGNAMEVECAKWLWSRSVAVTNIRYSGMLGDRDSKAFLALQELAPYPGVEECVNHSRNTWVLRWCSWPSSADRWERSWQVDPSQDTETTAVLPACHHIPRWWRWWYERCSVGHPPTLHEHRHGPTSYLLPPKVQLPGAFTAIHNEGASPLTSLIQNMAVEVNEVTRP